MAGEPTGDDALFGAEATELFEERAGSSSALEACDRCGNYADLVERGARRLCPVCDARRHPIVRDPFDAVHILKGVLQLSPRVGLRAAAIILLVNLPPAFLAFAVPPEGRMWVDLGWGAVFTPITTAVTIALAHQVADGGDPALATALGTALRSWPALFATNIIYGFAVAAGTLACLIPGMYVALIFSLSSPLVVNEGATPVAALGESAARLRNGRLQALAAFVVAWLAVTILFIGLAVVMGVVVGIASADDVDSALFTALELVIGWLASVVTLPAILVSAVMYEKLPSSLAVD